MAAPVNANDPSDYDDAETNKAIRARTVRYSLGAKAHIKVGLLSQLIALAF